MGFRYPQPDNEVGFEQMCLRLYRKVWNNESLMLYAKRGEKQDGIDIFDPLSIKPVRAVQCKHHEPTKAIFPSEIRAEVAKAEKSHFQIEHYLIATTARKSREAQDAIAELNLRVDKQFTVDIEFWEEICQHADALGRLKAELVIYGENILAGAVTDSQGGSLSPVFASHPQELPEGNDPYTLIERLLDQRRLDVARHELDKLPALESLPTDQQYKLLRLHAKLALENGEFEQASELFLQAYAVSPDLDQAKQNRVLAYSLRCEPEKAYEYAKQCVAEGLVTPIMILRLIENVPSKEQLEEHEPIIRTFVATDAGINTALAHKHIRFADYDLAYEAAQRALSMESDSPQVQLTVAMSLHSLAVHSDPTKRPDRLKLALAHYDTAAQAARDQHLTTLLPELYVNRAAAKALLCDESGAAADYRAAIDSATKPAIYVARAVSYFLQALDFDSATALIGSLDRTTREGQYLALVVEYHSADTTAKRRPIEEMATLAEQDWDRAVECRFQCVQWSLEQKEHELAESYVTEAFQLAHPFQAHTMLAWTYLESHDQGRAKAEALLAIDESVRAAHPQELRLLALILVKLKDDPNAVGLLEQVATPGVFDDDMKALLDCAQRMGRHDLLLRLCSELRATGATDERLRKLELQLLSEYAPTDALGLADEFIRSSDSPAYFVAARNVLAVRLKQPEKMNLDASALPTAAQLPPGEANLILLPYVTAGMYEDALRFLHKQRRIYFEDEDAHGRYLFFFLRHEPKIQLGPPSTVANDCAVLLEFTPLDRRWITLEDEQPLASRGEFASSSEFGQRLLGRKVGDTIELPGNVIQVETASIREIQTKYVRAFQDSFENFRQRFPGTSVLQRLQLGDPENFDPSPLIESLKSRREHIEECIALYSENPCSLYLFANSIGINELEAIKVLGQHPQGRVKSCQTTPYDFEQALDKTNAPPAIVLTISAIVTITQLNAWRYLGSATQYLVSQLTSELIDEWIHEITDNHAEKGGTAGLNEANQLVITDPTTEVHAARIEELNMIRQMVDKHCQKSSSVAVAHLAPEKRELYTQALGVHNLEAISVANDHHALLWSDDVLVGFVAETDFGVTNIWSQLALRCFMKWGGTMTVEEFSLATAKLAASDYENIIWNPETIIAAGVEVDWETTAWPLSKCIALIGRPHLHISAKTRIVVELLQRLRRSNCTDLKQSAVIQATLNALADPRAVRWFLRRVDDVFGVDVPSARFVRFELEYWLRLQ